MVILLFVVLGLFGVFVVTGFHLHVKKSFNSLSQ